MDRIDNNDMYSLPVPGMRPTKIFSTSVSRNNNNNPGVSEKEVDSRNHLFATGLKEESNEGDYIKIL
jgi:hypothetical protein